MQCVLHAGPHDAIEAWRLDKVNITQDRNKQLRPTGHLRGR
jgi:hypothetical protein